MTGGDRGGSYWGGATNDRLRGPAQFLTINGSVEYVDSTLPSFDTNNGFRLNSAGGYYNVSGVNYVRWAFSRAPGFFDEVCFAGNGSSTQLVNHNLAATPELIICKQRDISQAWGVWQTNYGSLSLNTSAASAGSTPVSTVTNNGTTQVRPYYIYNQYGDPGNNSNATMYLFASLPGVSKVGSYTGTGSTITVNCGFTGGARFVMIKNMNSSTDWFVWDTARGMVAGSDYRIALNSTVAESNSNWVYTTTGGFQVVVNNTPVNNPGDNYIYLAIA